MEVWIGSRGWASLWRLDCLWIESLEVGLWTGGLWSGLRVEAVAEEIMSLWLVEVVAGVCVLRSDCCLFERDSEVPSLVLN